jgi:hypothetical protein
MDLVHMQLSTIGLFVIECGQRHGFTQPMPFRLIRDGTRRHRFAVLGAPLGHLVSQEC